MTSSNANPGPIESRPYGLARVLGHTAWITLAALLMIAVTVYAVTGTPLVRTGIGGMVDSIGGFGSLALAAIALMTRFWKMTFDGTLRARDGAVEFVRPDGRVARTLAAGKVKGGWVVPRADVFEPVRVALETTRGTRIEAPVASVDEGEALLRGAGLDASHRRYETVLGSRVPSVLGAVVASSLSIGAIPMLGGTPGSFTNVLLVAMVILVGVAAAMVLAPPVITIGTDGLATQRPFARRFVSYADIAEVAVNAQGVSLHYRDGRHEMLASRGSVEAPAAFERRIRDAMRASSTGGTDAQALDALDRQGRAFSAWRSALASWAGTVSSFRSAPVTPEVLLDVLRDASAAATRRVGAALALMALGDGHREQLRAVAATAAEPHVRVALERVIEGEELTEREIASLEARDGAAG